jgi:hypothetical protein
MDAATRQTTSGRLALSVALLADYDFTEESRYGALLAKSDKIKAITAYERQHGTPVYYQFYNPWRLPCSRRVPIEAYSTPGGPLELGVRLVPSQAVHKMLAPRHQGYRPMIVDLKRGGVPDEYGWRLEISWPLSFSAVGREPSSTRSRSRRYTRSSTDEAVRLLLRSR